MKIKQKKNCVCMWGGGGGGVRVDVNEEFKFLMKIQKKKFFGGGEGVGLVGSGWL